MILVMALIVRWLLWPSAAAHRKLQLLMTSLANHGHSGVAMLIAKGLPAAFGYQPQFQYHALVVNSLSIVTN